MSKPKLTISKTKGLMGGAWCIDGTRIPVELLVQPRFEDFKVFLESYPQVKKILKHD